MACEGRNALADLSKRLATYVNMSSLSWAFRDETTKASRIIAELAKVEWRNMSGQYLPVINNGFVESLIKCRAIAEEGANDER